LARVFVARLRMPSAEGSTRAMRSIRIDPHAEQGDFEGWGTSLAWWANAVGRQPRDTREVVVRRIFGRAEGGLGMTIARFNAGGGENPGREVTLEPRMAMEGYRPAPDAELDESADPGQRAVLRDAARIVAEEGGELAVEVFGNSPPWWATLSGSVTGASRGRKRPAPNLAPSRTRDYLRYLHDVAEFVERDVGVRVSSLSPFNEPTSRWWVLGGRQEGCHFTAEGIDRVLTEVAEMPELSRRRIVAASEEWSLEQALAAWDALGPTARRAVGRLNVHTYDGESRSAVRARAVRAGVQLWVSEYGEGGALGRELALGIVRDLRELSPNAWVLWQAVSPDAWGPLRSAAGRSGVEATPKFAVLSRFTRAIRPGMRLVGTDDPLSVAAIGDGRFSAVIVAEGSAERLVRVEVCSAAVMAAAEVVLTDPAGSGPSTVLRIEPRQGVLSFRLPAGGVASVCAEIGVQPDGGFCGSGTWWLEHESGARLGLSATGGEELRAGVRLAGCAADDSSRAQRWRAEACGDGSARWVCEASGHQLDIRYASKGAGAHAIQWRAGLAETAPVHSRFEVVADAGGVAGGSAGEVVLRARHSGLVLALDARGRGVQRRLGEPGTRWRLVRVGPGAGDPATVRSTGA
jgi:O-glycosyl hydrolase